MMMIGAIIKVRWGEGGGDIYIEFEYWNSVFGCVSEICNFTYAGVMECGDAEATALAFVCQPLCVIS